MRCVSGLFFPRRRVQFEDDTTSGSRPFATNLERMARKTFATALLFSTVLAVPVPPAGTSQVDAVNRGLFDPDPIWSYWQNNPFIALWGGKRPGTGKETPEDDDELSNPFSGSPLAGVLESLRGSGGRFPGFGSIFGGKSSLFLLITHESLQLTAYCMSR